MSNYKRINEKFNVPLQIYLSKTDKEKLDEMKSADFDERGFSQIIRHLIRMEYKNFKDEQIRTGNM
jgi:predicted outer membrane protein